ncbi:uncharacterized protein CXorf38-like [Mercenaria mercenaria]|uniref:uncharacterized protein CXorf38-like n=1 Tax=Mercenaria mercenaria TaxID=6596 RepID=UPI00234F37F9|nr:uncharacterized protein CXorf38-like [Mercenaria mercenaria]XP_053389937.1 uncharacterized protein CXorf38-like [Mercenaria mercenaria]
MNNVKEKLKKNEYRNWVKGTLGLERTNRALFEYVKAKFEVFTHRRAGPHAYFTEDVYSHIHLGTSCIRSNLKRKIKYDKTNDTWKWTNPCGKCKEAFKSILSMYTNASKKKMHLENCENTTKVTLEWAIARFFMPERNDTNKGPDDTDPAAMINLLLNCHLFTNQIRRNFLIELREARNKLFHSSDNLVNDNVLKVYFFNMKGLLTDASHDTEVDNSIREVIAKDIQTIEQLEEAEISMTLFDDALKIQRKAIYEEYETCLQENNIEQLKVLLKLAENIAADLQFMNDHSEELKNVKVYMTKIEHLQTKEEELNAESMIIIVIVTIGFALLLRMCLYFG